jgi:hypothetical protein
MSSTSIFGFEHDDLERACLEVECALGARLERRESLYLGGEYCCGRPSEGQSLQLRHNRDPLFDEQSDPSHERFSEPDFPAARLLVYLHGVDSGRACQLLAHVTDISFLTEREIA